MRGYVSVAFGCPYQGAVAPSAVQDVARRLFDLGVQEVSLGDTIGVATPNQVPQVAGPLLEEFGAQRVALHLHDTRGTALANAFAGLLLGVTTFDSSAGGLGGCPYAPAPPAIWPPRTSSICCGGWGIETGVDLEAVARASRALSAVLGRSLRSRYLESTTPLP